MIRITLIIIFTSICNLTSATNYYVDKALGNDNNNGLTLTTAWQTIQKAASTVPPGSTILIKGGNYNENVTVNISGTAGSPIIFRPYNNDLVYLDGTGTNAAQGSSMLLVNGASHLEFRNLIIQNLLCSSATGFKIVNDPIRGTADIKIVNVTIRNIQWTALATTVPTIESNAHPFLVFGSGITQATAITDIVVDGCSIYNNVTGYSENLTITGNVDGFVLMNNIVRNNTNNAIDIAGNYGASSITSLDHARNGIIKNNKTYNNICQYTSSAGIYIDGGSNITVQNNESYNNSYGIAVGCEENGVTNNVMVKNNIIYNNATCGIYLGGYNPATTGVVSNTTIRNNSLFKNDTDNGQHGEMLISKVSNCKIENNVFYTNNQNILWRFDYTVPNLTNIFDYNCWYTPDNNPNSIQVIYPAMTYPNFIAYKAETGQDSHSLYSNPGFTNASLPTLDMSILSGSSCVNSANSSTILAADETDFPGSNRNIGSLDIGAYEYAASLQTEDSVNEDQSIIYPNPVAGLLHIETALQIQQILLYNQIGVLVNSYSYPSITELNLSELRTGLYFIRLDYLDKSWSIQKIIKK